VFGGEGDCHLISSRWSYLASCDVTGGWYLCLISSLRLNELVSSRRNVELNDRSVQNVERLLTQV
jgi:hypothetical protein